MSSDRDNSNLNKRGRRKTIMNSDTDNSNSSKRGHAVLFPGQSPGSFGPFVQILYHLDKLNINFIVTLVTPTRYFADLAKLQKTGALHSIDLRLEEISGMVPWSENHGELVSGELFSKQVFLETEQLRKRLATKERTPGAPTVIIFDMLLPWCKSFADKLQIRCYPFYHCAPHYALMMLEFPKAVQAAFTLNRKRTDEDEYFTDGDDEYFTDGDDEYITDGDDEYFPAVVPDLMNADVLSLLHSRGYPAEVIECPEYVLSIVQNTMSCSGILLNTARALDVSSGVLSAVERLMGHWSRVFCIGPSVQIPGFGLAYSSASTDEILPWLNLQHNNSVLYVAFESVAIVSKELMAELAAALESSCVPFLLVLRTASEKLSEILPPGFEQRISGRGRIETGWVNQPKILQHPAIGAFMTHCGWNSILEGICSGVPFIAWPILIDQLNAQNARHVYLQDAKIGIAIADLIPKGRHTYDGVLRREIELAIRKVMLEEEGHQLRKNVEELQRLAVTATARNGSSYQDARRFLDQISVSKLDQSEYSHPAVRQFLDQNSGQKFHQGQHNSHHDGIYSSTMKKPSRTTPTNSSTRNVTTGYISLQDLLIEDPTNHILRGGSRSPTRRGVYKLLQCLKGN